MNAEALSLFEIDELKEAADWVKKNRGGGFPEKTFRDRLQAACSLMLDWKTLIAFSCIGALQFQEEFEVLCSKTKTRLLADRFGILMKRDYAGQCGYA